MSEIFGVPKGGRSWWFARATPTMTGRPDNAQSAILVRLLRGGSNNGMPSNGMSNECLASAGYQGTYGRNK